VAALAVHRALRGLRRGDRKLLAASADPITFAAGSVILRSGKIPTECFVFVCGTLASQEAVTDAASAFVGLHGRFAGVPSARDVLAESEVSGYALDGRYVRQLVLRNPVLLTTTWL
jgi:hypothetical protein